MAMASSSSSAALVSSTPPPSLPPHPPAVDASFAPPNHFPSSSFYAGHPSSSFDPRPAVNVLEGRPSEGSFERDDQRDFGIVSRMNQKKAEGSQSVTGMEGQKGEVDLTRLSVQAGSAIEDDEDESELHAHQRDTSSLSTASGSGSGLTPTPGPSGPVKTRRASSLSTASSEATVESMGRARADLSPSGSGAGGKGVRDPARAASRKAARREVPDETPAREQEDTRMETGQHADEENSRDDEVIVPEAETATHEDDTPSYAPSPHYAHGLPPIAGTPSSAPPRFARSAAPTSVPLPGRPAQKEHVDIVSYPSADLLRLLASLLEQIAHANDALNQRIRSRPGSGTNTPGGKTRDPSSSSAARDGEEEPTLEQGRFDAAPLNSPVTPRFQDGVRRTKSADGMEVDTESSEREENLDDMLPVTPGVDLLREVGEGGGAEGFMPSLGGAHTPVPLARRRGSSFLTKRDNEANASASGSSSMTRGTGSSNGADSSTPATILEKEPPLTSLLTASSLALSSPSATLCFHARNIPAISIEAYLLRILKYCPTTNEVFLSLLVYFDRMARVGLEAQRVGLVGNGSGTGGVVKDGDSVPRLFAIDSFNVHRLVIAGVTVASKFFSDVFYTNSRYAKVGGLPLNELNQLELQFLLLNDFRLVIPVDELQRYADQLILFWIGRNGSNLGTHPHPDSTNPIMDPVPSPLVEAAQAKSYFPSSVGRAPHLTPGKADATTTVSYDQSTPPSSTPSGNRSVETSPRSALERHRTSQEALHLLRQQETNITPPHHPYSTSQNEDSLYSHHHSRPRSLHSQPSSSGTSVTSTITPGSGTGTPKTPQGIDGEDDHGENRIEFVGDQEETRMDED